ncbi:MAG: hypothetical protein QM541_08895 [Flavobacterium sp.]|nr:hypothetical protein [Flavobacterium sp.]
MSNKKFTVKRFPIDKKIVADIAAFNKYVNLMHGLFQIDIAHIRQQIKIAKKEQNLNVSILACLLYCFAQALDKYKDAFAMVGKGSKYYQFEEADVFFPFELQQNGEKIIWYKIIRRVNKKTIVELEDDLKKMLQMQKTFTKAERFFMRFPGFLRRLFYGRTMRNPLIRKSYVGNVYFSSTIHSGNTRVISYGLPSHFHSVGMFIGTFIDVKSMEPQKPNANIVGATLSLDHLISDGSMLARLIREFVFQVENFKL